MLLAEAFLPLRTAFFFSSLPSCNDETSMLPALDEHNLGITICGFKGAKEQGQSAGHFKGRLLSLICFAPLLEIMYAEVNPLLQASLAVFAVEDPTEFEGRNLHISATP